MLIALASSKKMSAAAVVIFDDVTGRSIEIDTRGTARATMARLERRTASDERARSWRAILPPPKKMAGYWFASIGTQPIPVTW
jgi:hypothetical protein